MPPPVGERIPEAWETALGCTSVGPVIKIPTYKGLSRGSKVILVDPYWPRLHGMRFEFLAYCHNTESGVGWLEVYGGPAGQQWVRSFPVHAMRKLGV